VDWTIQDYGALGELVGAIVVVITLVYLAFQIRQNTRQLEQNTLIAITAAITASNIALREPRESLYESAEMAEIFMRGNENPEELDEVPRLRYRLAMQNVVDAMLEVYSQTLMTNFSPETWATQGVTLVERVLGTNGGKWFWATYAKTYPIPFRAEVNRILQDSLSGPQ
jgi:hypothetical protein